MRDPAELRRHKTIYDPLTGSPTQAVSGMGRQRVAREISGVRMRTRLSSVSPRHEQMRLRTRVQSLTDNSIILSLPLERSRARVTLYDCAAILCKFSMPFEGHMFLFFNNTFRLL